MCNASVTFRYSARCEMRSCFLGMGLGVECVRDFFLSIVLGVECARDYSVLGLSVECARDF